MDFDETYFIKAPDGLKGKENALIEAKQALVNRLFVGNYEMRKYVNELNQYRDVIKINTAEKELLSILKKTKQSLIKNCDAKWIGIHGPDQKDYNLSDCLWVNCNNLPFGVYWFQIKQIKEENNEIFVKLKSIREVNLQVYGDMNKTVFKDEIPGSNEEKKEGELNQEYTFDFDPAGKLRILFSNLNEVFINMNHHLTWQNIVLACRFAFAVMSVILAGIFISVKNLGDFVLKFIRECAHIIESLSPIIMHGMDCITRVTGMIIFLFASIFANIRNEQPRRQNPPPPNGHQYHAIEYKPRLSPGSSYDFNYKPVPENWRERNRNLKMDLFSQW